MDEKLLSFMADNMVTIGIVLAILKAIAVETPSNVDNKIVGILTGIFDNKARGSDKNE